MVETLWALIGVAVGLAGVAQWLSSGEEGEERMTHSKAEREAVDRAMTVGGMSVGEARKDAPTAPSGRKVLLEGWRRPDDGGATQQ